MAASSGGSASAVIGRHVEPDQREEGNAEIGPARPNDRPKRPRRSPRRRLASTAAIASRDERPVVTTSSTMQHFLPRREAEAAAQLERALRPFDEHRRLAQRPAHFMADDHAAHGRRDDGLDLARASPRESCRPARRARRSRRAPDPSARARIADNAGSCRPEERMKWPSSSAPAARNSSRIWSSLIIRDAFRPLGEAHQQFAITSWNGGLRLGKPRPIEPRKSGAHPRSHSRHCQGYR